tara:strand:+ start:609 stop:1040 length:432 start_codon:yes stop_codon:yes gene_type:complete
LNTKINIVGKYLFVNDQKIRITKEKDLRKIKWSDINAEYIIDSTGIFLTEELANAHILAGAKKVIMSAPSKDETLMLVMGVNHLNYNSRMNFVSNDSCTTNCLAHDNFHLTPSFSVKTLALQNLFSLFIAPLLLVTYILLLSS